MNSVRFRVRRLIVVAADGASIVLAQLLAYLLRFDFNIPPKEWDHFLVGIAILIPLKFAVFYWFNLYKGMWRYTGMNDLRNLVKANFMASLLIFSLLLLVNRFHGLSRSVFLMDGVLCFLFTSGFRLLIRIHFSHRISGQSFSVASLVPFRHKAQQGAPTLVLGAGAAGEALIREISANPSLNIHPVGFLDDAPEKRNRSLHTIPVLGGIENIDAVVTKYGVKQIFIAMPSATPDQMRRIVKLCESTGVTYKTLPGMGNIIDGSARLKDLRDVNYEDLLGRPPVELDDQAISRYITGNTIMVTGAGGSIGSELCRQIVKYRPRHLVMLDNSEINLFTVEAELQKHADHIQFTGLLGRVQDRALLDDIFTTCAPRIVFHAAAYKHVHLVERSPWEGVFNNIIGSKVLMTAALKHGVDRFVVISTDKAVRPTNVMGACKRVTELLARSFNGSGTKFMAVRFGNVVGSSGSVVPFFQQQIKNGGPVTVTHKDATRYFMTIPEASRLVLQAGAIGNGGEIFVLQMGTPVRIMQMAEDLIRLSGKEPYKDIDIVITGLRAGEKVFEELITDGEGIADTIHDKILVLSPNSNGNAPQDLLRFRKDLETNIDLLCAAAIRCDSEEIKSILQEMVHEYKPADRFIRIDEARARAGK